MANDDKQVLFRAVSEPPASAAKDGRVARARRRFVKGTALALPAIITLRSGAALAQNMTTMTCGQKDPPFDNLADTDDGSNGPEDAAVDPITAMSSQILRTQVTVYGTTTDPSTPVWYLDTYTDPNLYRSVITGDVEGNVNTPPADINDTPAAMNWQAIANMNTTTGEIVGVNPEPPPGTALTSAAGNCMASLMAQT